MTSRQIQTVIPALLVLMATPGMAEVSVIYLGNLDSYPTLEHTSSYDDLYGNLGQPGGMIVDEEYSWELGTATTFDPLAGDGVCSLGFVVEVLHMVVVKTDSIPTTFYPNLGIGDAFLRDTYPPEATCFLPTPCPIQSYNYPRYSYAEATVTLVDPGYYEIVFTGDFSDSDCIYSNYTHTISSWLNFMANNIFFVSDDNPGHCPDHYATTWFSGECRWNEIAASGNMLLWAEVSCCDVPVSTEKLSFDALKSFYR